MKQTSVQEIIIEDMYLTVLFNKMLSDSWVSIILLMCAYVELQNKLIGKKKCKYIIKTR